MRSSTFSRPLIVFAVLSLLTGAQLAGCGGQTQRPLAVPVQVGVPGYTHELALTVDMLCEQRGGRMRCRGFHPLSEELEDAWMSYGDGFSRASLAGLGVCGLRAGRVLCWGVELDDRELNIHESVVERVCARQTFTDLLGVRELGMGDFGGCVITAEGMTRCWGAPVGLEDPHDGRLYDVARAAHGLAVGPYLGCAITERGLRCWGEVVGLGAELDYPPAGRSVAVPVPEPVQVVVGDGFGCARTEGHHVYCWGDGLSHALGRGPVGDDPQPPTRIDGLEAIDLVASETSVCARRLDGRTLCWGMNESGQLGLGHTRQVDVPTHVPALDGALDLALASMALCARMPDGGVHCAGDIGALTLDERLNQVGATRLPGPPATHVVVDSRGVCVVTAQGNRCYGDGGAIGRGHQEAAAGWSLGLPDETALSQVASLNPNPCLRFQDGSVRCERGERPPIVLTGTHALATNGSNVCAVDQAHKVQCWSRFDTATAPAEIPAVAGAVSLDLTTGRACAVLANGGLQCWLLGSEPNNRVPGPTTDLRDLRAVALSGVRTCALRQGGQVMCWQDSVPLTGTLEGVSQLARLDSTFLVVVAGMVHEVRVHTGELALGAAVPGVTGVVQLSAAGRTACARNEGGEVRCWGANDYSQFGVLPSTVQLALTALVDREVEPDAPAMLECGPAPRPYDDEGYDDDY